MFGRQVYANDIDQDLDGLREFWLVKTTISVPIDLSKYLLQYLREVVLCEQSFLLLVISGDLVYISHR